MVRIIDGEIVADDDPRLQQYRPRQQQQPPQPRDRQRSTLQAPPAVSGNRFAFDFNAPPFKILPAQAPNSLPDFAVFGARVPALALIAAAAAGMLFGWRGLLAAVIIGYLLLSYQASHQAGVGHASGNHTPGSAMSAMAAAAFNGNQNAADATTFQPASHNQQQSRAAAGPWSGKGHKLGSG